MSERFLVTGVLGCLGAWVARTVLHDGDEVVGFDLGEDTARLRLVLGDADADRVTLVRGDITDHGALARTLDEHAITRVVHLAALQVPLVRANPSLGMRVNVVGTVNVFEAVAGRLGRIAGVAYASSAAVYSPSDPSPAPESGGTTPSTLYGVSKLAAEGIARVYAAGRGLPSVGLRPYVVYGPGRDQGMTSGATMAMRAAARGEPYTIGYSGRAQYDYAPDVARAFVTAAGAERTDAAVFNTHGVGASADDVVAAIRAVVPDAEITWEGETLPFPAELEAVGFDRDVGPFPRTSLDAGVAATIAHFRAAA
ncbi:MAG TPA: NAD(P)-dependent oxidoreductase [Gaiella sp.]|nr:NAD(P)-dependent oxidoreductase [Gaiella sp.]